METSPLVPTVPATPLDAFSDIEECFLRSIESLEFLLLTLEHDFFLQQEYSSLIYDRLQWILAVLQQGKQHTQNSGKVFFQKSQESCQDS